MSESNKVNSEGRLIWNTVVRYLLWIFTSLIFIICAVQAGTTVRKFVAVIDTGLHWAGVAWQAGMIVFGLTVVVLIFAIEGKYRTAAQSGSKRLLKKFAVVTAFQVGFLILTFLLIILSAYL
jgi:hypothetical protein